MMSLTTQRPSELCKTMFMEPVLRPRKNNSVGLSNVISVSATPSVMPPAGAGPGAGAAAPGVPAGAPAWIGRPARLPAPPPTTIRATGKLSRTTCDLPNVRIVGGSTVTAVQGLSAVDATVGAGLVVGPAALADAAACGEGGCGVWAKAEMARAMVAATKAVADGRCFSGTWVLPGLFFSSGARAQKQLIASIPLRITSTQVLATAATGRGAGRTTAG